jgi:valyl-tRNA synthetase
VILPNGRIDESVPFIVGMKVHAARQESLRYIGRKGLMVKSEEIVHSVSTHERCGKPIEIIPSRQCISMY